MLLINRIPSSVDEVCPYADRLVDPRREPGLGRGTAATGLQIFDRYKKAVKMQDFAQMRKNQGKSSCKGKSAEWEIRRSKFLA
jgi:hypothetical protein